MDQHNNKIDEKNRIEPIPAVSASFVWQTKGGLVGEHGACKDVREPYCPVRGAHDGKVFNFQVVDINHVHG